MSERNPQLTRRRQALAVVGLTVGTLLAGNTIFAGANSSCNPEIEDCTPATTVPGQESTSTTGFNDKGSTTTSTTEATTTSTTEAPTTTTTTGDITTTTTGDTTTTAPGVTTTTTGIEQSPSTVPGTSPNAPHAG